jgi:drug/metabolite transporter (DMT)-like permease
MPISALGLLIIAAMLHAGWNLLLKNTDHKYVVLWWGMAIGSVLCLPILLLRLPLPSRIWPYALASALFEAIYDGTLAAAYQKEDFSLVYPIARGGAPALLALWAIIFLKETPSATGKVGLAVLTGGLMIVGSSKWWSVRKKGIGSATGFGLACLVALTISIYSVIDGAAVKLADAAAYTVLVFVLTAIFAIPVIFKLYGWGAIKTEGRSHWLRAAAIGCLSLLAYMLVLYTYTFAPVSYGGAIREISIVFGALAGWLWLKESFGFVRAIGAAVIFAGILTILLGG